MDLLRTMMANRQAQGVVMDPKPRAEKGKKQSKAVRAEGKAPGSKAMRHHIIEEKPSKKVVREHFKAIVEEECASESESD